MNLVRHTIKVCKAYLSYGGYLLDNNIHGNAITASLERDYQLIAAVHCHNGKYRLSTASMEEYFIPKRNFEVTRELLLERGKGIGYTKAAALYLFEKVR